VRRVIRDLVSIRLNLHSPAFAPSALSSCPCPQPLTTPNHVCSYGTVGSTAALKRTLTCHTLISAAQPPLCVGAALASPPLRLNRIHFCATSSCSTPHTLQELFPSKRPKKSPPHSPSASTAAPFSPTCRSRVRLPATSPPAIGEPDAKRRLRELGVCGRV
jgi:hypothetical protein